MNREHFERFVKHNPDVVAAWNTVCNAHVGESHRDRLIAWQVIEELRETRGIRVTNNIKPHLARHWNARHPRARIRFDTRLSRLAGR